MDYLVSYSQFLRGELNGKAVVVLSAENIVQATEMAIEVVKTFSDKNPLVSGAEEKVRIEKIINY